jgi:hypothetical protein
MHVFPKRCRRFKRLGKKGRWPATKPKAEGFGILCNNQIFSDAELLLIGRATSSNPRATPIW